MLGNGIAGLVATYSAAAWAGPAASAIVPALFTVSSLVFENDQGDLAPTAGDLVLMLVAWGIGWFAWRRRHDVEQSLELADEQVRSADERADEALAQERRRIARELHDVVSDAVTGGGAAGARAAGAML